MRTLITGAGGFIGRELVAHLKGNDPSEEIITVGRRELNLPVTKHFRCNLTEQEKVAEIFRAVQPNRVYHLAGISRVAEGILLPQYFSENFLTTLSILNASRLVGNPVALFLASSVHVYGNQDGVVSEDAIARPVSYYGFSKYLAEEAARHHARGFAGLGVVVGRLYNCIGPGQGSGFVVPDLVGRIRQLPQVGKGILQTGPLSTLRGFIDVRDVVKIIPRLLVDARMGDCEVYNVSSPGEHSIREILESLLAISGKSPRIESREDANPFNGLKVSVRKLQSKVPQMSLRPIHETLKDIYQS